jgi:3-phenylpropionate/trans-cinnamate dioxygenase alpha subunit
LALVPEGVIRDYHLKHFDELVERIGPELADRPGLVTTVFPNVSPNFTRHMIRVWHPRGPEKTEIWSYCVVDKDAPVEVKEAMRLYLTQTFGPAGNLEQDDMNNWVQCTNTAHGLIARRYPQNIQAHMGHEDKSGPIGGGRRLRAFYARWEMMMKAENWSQVDLKTKYF